MKGALALLVSVALLQLVVVQAQPRCGDVCFAIDDSGSLDEPSFDAEVAQVGRIVDALEDISNNVRYSALTFGGDRSNPTPTVSALTNNPTLFKNRLDMASFSNGPFTPTDDALNACKDLLDASGNSRPKTIVLLTDGMPTNRNDAIDAANAVKASGITLITVGFQSANGLDFLKMIASSEDLSFDSVTAILPGDMIAQLAIDVCGGACQIACDECELKFQGTSCTPLYDVPTTSNVAFTSKIMMKDGMPVIGIVNSNNLSPEFIFDDGTVSNIENFPESGQKYSRSQFKPITISSNSKMSGIGHENFQGASQKAEVRDKCVRVYFTSYQILDPHTKRVVGNVNDVNTKGTNCAVFRTAE